MRAKLTHGVAAFVATGMLIFASGAASASAASWHVGGTELLTSASLAPATEEAHTTVIETAGIRIECSEAPELAGASIKPSNGGKIGHLVFKGCSILTGLCSLASRSIETKPLTLEAGLGAKAPEDTLLLKPESGTTFADIKIEGSRCALLGTMRLTGKAKFLMPHGREELAAQELQFRAGPAELRWESAEVSLSGSAKAKLASGSAWSFR